MTSQAAHSRAPLPPDGRRVLPLLSLAALLAAAPVFAQSSDAATKKADAQAPAEASSDSSDQTIRMDTYVVTGYQRSLALSLDTKRNANAIVDVITAEDVGKFPDTNVAESLSHVPGVTVDRLFGQGERVSILGTDPNLNRTLLNGEDVASGDWFILDAPSRQFNYTLLAPEVIGQAEVYKSSEAWLPEGSIGGTIMLHTRNPLDTRQYAFSGSAGDMYNDRDKHNDYSFSQVASVHNKDKTFGIMVGIQSSREHLRRDGVEALGTVSAGAASPATGIDPAAPAGSVNLTNPTALLPNAINAALFQQVRERTGGNIVIDARPSEYLDFEANVLHSKVNDNNFNTSYYGFPGWWRGAVIQNGSIVNNIVDSASISQNIGVMDLFYRVAAVKTDAYDQKLTFHNDAISVSEHAGYTQATGGTQAQYYIEPLLGAPGAGVGTTSYTYTGGVSNPGFTWGKSGVNTDPTAWTVGGPWWNGNVASDPEKDQESYAQLDATYSPRNSVITKVRAGVRYTDHITSQNWYNISLVTLPSTTLASFNPSLTPSNYLSGLPNITTDMSSHVMIDPTALYKAVYASPYQAGSSMNMQQALAAGEGFQPTQSFEVDETTKAGYGQADFQQGKLSGNVGLRWVQTTTTSKGWAVSGSTTTPIAMKKTYDNFLPSLNLAYSVNHDFIVRAAAAEVIARPNYADLSSSVMLYDSIRTGVGGNPKLDPYKSTNFDLSGEWYFSKDSALAVSFFYKDISNYILKSNGTESYFNQNLGKVTPYLISRPENAGHAKSQGFSVYYQHTFPYGLGVTANYTYVDASGENGAELPYASKNQINFSPYIQHGKFLFRLTYAWRSDYFTNVDRGNNVYTRAYTELDANASYAITKHLSLTVACENLLDETYYIYAKVPANMFQAEYKNGRRLQAGLHWNF
ncbi:vitamin B12 transporter BtuB [mine drainage metagenome]|uniref:Vitamin B12 transporter BtuB n=1 Tax=mine drainage metagenome TaxID=410659 RepID=A0A1J5T5S3_9ZZZZ